MLSEAMKNAQIAVIDMDEKRAASALRISPHFFNTEEEITHCFEVLSKLL